MFGSKATVTPATRFTEMKASLMLHHPFFASMMFDVMNFKLARPEEEAEIRTAATDGRNAWFNGTFITSLTLDEAVFVACHEIAHVMWQHMARGKRYEQMGFEGRPFNHKVYNYATDYVINDMLVKSNVGAMPKCGLRDPKYTWDMNADDVYRELMKDPDKLPSGGFDNHIFKDLEIPPEELERAIIAAANNAKAVGKLPGAMERFVEEILNPKVNWADKLRHSMTRSFERQSSSWASPHRRRLVSQKVYYPRPTGIGAGAVVWVSDTSGSMGQREYDAAVAEVADILSTCKPRDLWVLGCDSAVASVEHMDSSADLVANPPVMEGGGGTSFNPPFVWVEEEDIRPDILVYFTDGYGDWPDRQPDYPVVWIMTTDVVPPWGEYVKVEL